MADKVRTVCKPCGEIFYRHRSTGLCCSWECARFMGVRFRLERDIEFYEYRDVLIQRYQREPCPVVVKSG